MPRKKKTAIPFEALLLDQVIAMDRKLESENLAAARMEMSLHFFETPLGMVPLFVLTPFLGIVQTTAHRERHSFLEFAKEVEPDEETERVLQAIRPLCNTSIICTERSFVRSRLEPGGCQIAIGTEGQPGWTNQIPYRREAHEDLKKATDCGGALVEFIDRDEVRRRSEPPPEPPDPDGWSKIWNKEIGKVALQLAKRSRDRLILLLAAREHMVPRQISSLNLDQVRQKWGRKQRNVYLGKRIIRKKDVAEALWAFRKNEREWCWDREPLFRVKGATPKGRSRRLGEKPIQELIVRYVKRARKQLRDEGRLDKVDPPWKPPEPPPLKPVFWVPRIEIVEPEEEKPERKVVELKSQRSAIAAADSSDQEQLTLRFGEERPQEDVKPIGGEAAFRPQIYPSPPPETEDEPKGHPSHAETRESIIDEARSPDERLLKISAALEWPIQDIISMKGAIKRRLEAIEEKGLTHATPYWRSKHGQPRFLYLIHPTDQGSRQREYIGSDPERIIEALVRVKRGHEHRELTRKLEQIVQRLEQMRGSIEAAYELATQDADVDSDLVCPPLETIRIPKRLREDLLFLLAERAESGYYRKEWMSDEPPWLVDLQVVVDALERSQKSRNPEIALHPEGWEIVSSALMELQNLFLAEYRSTEDRSWHRRAQQAKQFEEKVEHVLFFYF